MKARFKATGEIIEVELNENIQPLARTGALHIYSDSVGNNYLDTELDFENLLLPQDWEQVRIKAAIAAMQGVLSNPAFCNISTNKQFPIKIAIYSADALIEELKNDRHDRNN